MTLASAGYSYTVESVETAKDISWVHFNRPDYPTLYDTFITFKTSYASDNTNGNIIDPDSKMIEFVETTLTKLTETLKKAYSYSSGFTPTLNTIDVTDDNSYRFTDCKGGSSGKQSGIDKKVKDVIDSIRNEAYALIFVEEKIVVFSVCRHCKSSYAKDIGDDENICIGCTIPIIEKDSIIIIENGKTEVKKTFPSLLPALETEVVETKVIESKPETIHDRIVNSCVCS